MRVQIFHTGRLKAMWLLMTLLLFAVIQLTTFGCEVREKLEDPSGQDEIQTVSLLSLIVTPKDFDRSRIFVQGFIVREFEEERLYFSDRDADYVIAENSVRLDFDGSPNSISTLNHCYVVVEGTFSIKERGDGLSPDRSIRAITRLSPSITRSGENVPGRCVQ